MVSNSFSQKSHKGESTFLNLNSILFVYKILFNILYWNSLNLVSNVVLKGSRYKPCNLESFVFIKNIFIMKSLTDFRKTVARTGVDPSLSYANDSIQIFLCS